MPVEAVIYDIGNVLIEWQPERHYDKTIGEKRRREMFEAVDLHAMNDEIDRGAAFKERIYEEAEKHPQFRAEIRDWYDSWIEMASPAIPHSVKLLRTLRSKDIPVFALSNFGVDSFAYAETKYPFLGEFDRRYISGHMKRIKPEPEIYEMVEQDCGIDPAGLLFVDDRQDNIDMARARGWQAHLFEGPQGWADELVRQGLLNAEEASA
ncbi:HAD family phosphatase [Halocynthiibacter sp. C4]|uniref:HAD family hydrolase n=1 Tax=Halocynthiibacter sp. C4 TaxID=2992758 RepID=UPI00237C31A0|nr:HAD family phosphatase [Halocynthiibacter sp. C4]MDE0588378.1 HAD family phosphatase [Halocynthiibacter sp. C4]